MTAVSWVGLLVGLAIVLALVAWQGVHAVAEPLSTADWRLLLLAAFALPDLALSAASWRLLFAPGRGPRFGEALRAMWIGTSVNLLLPMAMIGGELVKARLLMLWASCPGPDAVASIVVDKTVQAIAVLLSALIGIGVLLLLADGNGGGEFVIAAAAGTGLLALGITGFVLVQHAGPFAFLAGSARRLGPGGIARRAPRAALRRGAGDADAAIRALYRRPGTLSLACALRLAARVVLAGEVWLAAYLMGQPIGLAEAVMLRTLAVALRGAAFVVPAGLGIQEGGYVALGAVIGLPADLALAIGLATRVREVVPSLPGLVAWQHAEGSTLWRRRRSETVGGRPADRGGG